MAGPLVIPRAEHNLSRQHIIPEALKVLYRLKEAGHVAYLAGGGVRDLLLGRRPKDFDVATDATPRDMRRVFGNCRLIGRRFRLAHVYFHNGVIIEVATFRGDSAPDVPPAPMPHAEVPPGDDRAAGPRTPIRRDDGLILRDNIFGTPEDDARRRDFTVNALFYDIRDFSIIDYVGGLADLKERVLRSIGPPATRYAEDPVRMVRAVRFAAMLDFWIEEATYRAISHTRHSILKASNARMYEEVLKLLQCGAAWKALALLAQTGLRPVMFPHWGQWIEHHASDGELERLQEVCAQIDARVFARRPIKPAAMLAALWRDYLEGRALILHRQGLARTEALSVATSHHLTELAACVFVPKRVGDQICHLLATGHVNLFGQEDPEEAADRPEDERSG